MPRLKRKAPTRLSGDSGARYENQVAAQFLLDLLSGTNSLGADFGRIMRVDWQARDAGWLADDLALTCQHTGEETRSIGLSIKSDQQVTTKGFPTDFVDLSWGQWLEVGTNRAFKKGCDSIALVTADISPKVMSDWSALLKEIISSTSERIVSRLNASPAEGAQASAHQRSLVKSFACPPRFGREPNQAETIELLRNIRVLNFNFDKPTSQHESKAVIECQKLLVSGDPGEARELWHRLVSIADELRPTGGSLDLPGLLSKLRARFQLIEHPDYRADLNTLRRVTNEAIDNIGTQVANVVHLPRENDLLLIRQRLASEKTCLLIGESGSGKSAFLKEIALADYPLVIWLSWDSLDHTSESAFERSNGLRHPLLDILGHTIQPCLVVFDGIEGFSERAMRLCASFSAKLHKASFDHVHVAFTLQHSASENVIRSLRVLDVPQAMLKVMPVNRIDEREVYQALQSFPNLQGLSRRPELGPLLTNLKVLDWFASMTAPSEPDDKLPAGLTDIIDDLWAVWTERHDDGASRSHLLMTVARAEADTLSHGYPRTKLDLVAQPTLNGLTHSGLVRVSQDRVYFTHELLGDWARLKVLLAEAADTTTVSRAKSPAWHQAVRLFALHLLEGTPASKERWRRAVEIESDAPSDAGIVRDLFLDALCLAPTATQLLVQTWPLLTAQNGKLLNRLLNRFFIVATVPDVLLLELIGSKEQAEQVEHLFRIPYWPYWLPFLLVLHTKRDDVARVAPQAAARICELWLRGTSGGFPLRRETAELAYVIAREIQRLNAEEHYYSAGQDKIVYEAFVLGAPLLPDKIAALSLELACRRDLSPDIAARAERAPGKRLREQAKRPTKARPPIFARRRRSDPWPDGPRGRLDHEFRSACLSGQALTGLIKAAPDAALEVLLAVCIEEPPYDDYLRGSSLPETGLSSWHEGEPAAYFRGPFYSFFVLAPSQAFSFVIKLTNFSTHRYTEDKYGLDITIGTQSKRWYGDSNVFRWHCDWPVMHGAQVQCALMALEKWLYDEIDRGHPIEAWVQRIVSESESLAFAGLLMNVGKRAPQLFLTALKPLFFTWMLWSWDHQLSNLPDVDRGLAGYWGNQPKQFIEMARVFHALPHRSQALLDPDGVIARTMLGHAQLRPFFEEVRAAWATKLADDDERDALRCLIERMNPGNYAFETRGTEIVPVRFSWPPGLAEENDAALRKIAEDATITALPWQCRQALDSGAQLSPDERQYLWDLLHSLEAKVADPAEAEAGSDPFDSIIGGIALLLATSREWLVADPSRAAWWRLQLQRTLDRPPATLGASFAAGNQQWDSFAAECGVLLLTKDANDPLGRSLVAAGVTAYRYATTGLTMMRASQVREHLGLHFDKLVTFATLWAALRPRQPRSADSLFDVDWQSFNTSKTALVRAFLEDTLSARWPDLRMLDTETRAVTDALYEKQYQGARTQREGVRQNDEEKRQRKLHPQSLAIDTEVLKGAFSWLDIGAARTPRETSAWFAWLQALLVLVLDTVPVVAPDSRDEIDGLPSDFDTWVLQIVAESIPQLRKEDADSLWKPILDRSAPARAWIERFFWHWFTNGLTSSTSAVNFVRIWQSMILFALAHRGWTPSVASRYDVERAAAELLGLDRRWNAVFRDDKNAPAIAGLGQTYCQALGRWGSSAMVISGFAALAVMPASKSLLLPALKWMLPGLKGLHSYEWEHGLEDNLIDFVDAWWKHHRQYIASDETFRDAFLTVMGLITARGSAAGIALSKRIRGSAGI